MKLSIDIDATPQELREFFGLPDIAPLQEEMLSTLRDNMLKAVSDMDPAHIAKNFMSPQMQGMDTLQKAFWGAFANAGKKSGSEDK